MKLKKVDNEDEKLTLVSCAVNIDDTPKFTVLNNHHKSGCLKKKKLS